MFGERVSMLMREVAADVVMPRFRSLAPREIAEKTPGEIVTIADREAEERLYDGLAALAIDAHILGEEAVSRDPGLLDGIGAGRVWHVDPLDGTAHFEIGRESGRERGWKYVEISVGA